MECGVAQSVFSLPWASSAAVCVGHVWQRHEGYEFNRIVLNCYNRIDTCIYLFIYEWGSEGMSDLDNLFVCVCSD